MSQGAARATLDRVRETRARMLAALGAAADRLTADSVAAMRAAIPAYAGRDEAFYADVSGQIRAHLGAKLTALAEERDVTLEEISFVRAAATRRARAGLALEDYINAFRVGQRVFWDAVMAVAEEEPLGHEAALTLTGPLMRYCDIVSTHAAHAYVGGRGRAGHDREPAALAEHLLAGELPARGPLRSLAAAYGIGADSVAMVAVAAGAGGDPEAAAAAAARELALVRVRERRPLVVTRRGEVVVIAVPPAGGSLGEVCDRLEDLHARLREEGTAVTVGVGTPARGTAELPRAYREARLARQYAPAEGGVLALPRLSPMDFLTLRADGTAWRLVDPRLRRFLAADRGRGGVLTATIRAFAGADLNLRAAAARLQIHHNTAQYRLRRIEEITGRNPRHIADLLDLLVAIALHDTTTPPPP